MGQSFLLEHGSGIRRQYLTYIPLVRGFIYLVAIMDWHSRAVSGLANFEHAARRLLR
jgi:hypothetical protein